MSMSQIIKMQLQELATWAGIKAALGTFLMWFLELAGHPGVPFLVLFSLMLFDLALGVARACMTVGLRQSRLAKGATKFFWYWLAVVIMGHVDVFVLPALPEWMPFGVQYALTAYLAINEALSCTDHLSFFGVPMPQGLVARLINYRDNFGHLEDKYKG